MVMDYLENIIQLLAILFSLLIALFRYINTKRRRWMCAVLFFLGSLLSSYFWTAYLVIMGDTPDVSDFLAYFGWNTAFVAILMLEIYSKKKEERLYFHPLMLVPIPLNIWQLSLYLEYGGVANSIYQVAICTLIEISCIQTILQSFRKKEDKKPPYVSITVFIYACSEFGMWTTSCFDGFIGEMYYLFSFLSSLDFLFLIWALERYRKENSNDSEMLINKYIQHILMTSYVAIVILCSLGGILLGNWIRDILAEGIADGVGTEVYKIIPVILFVISIVLVAFAIAIIFIVYFEQKIAENRRLNEAKVTAERSNAAKSEFLANMSHEIRTPINAVLGLNEIVLHESIKARDRLPLDTESLRSVFSKIVSHAGNIDSAGNNLLSIINDILDFSKIEAGKMEIVEAEYRLSSILNDVSNMCIFKARAKGLDFNVEVEDDLPDGLYGDEVRIRQVITNILNNAVKYTREGSVTLFVNGSGQYEPGQNADLIIKVKDTGIGIKEEDLGRLFGKFERMDLKKNSTVEGTGLGLAITRHLVEMMGGSIAVESKYGEGSVFTITVPQKIVSVDPVGDFREKFEESMEGSVEEQELFYAPTAQILIVDDTQMNLVVAKELLADTGIRIDAVQSGAEAIRYTLETPYDLILLDQRMPEMDGTETLHHLREQTDGLNYRTPVICLTADAIAGARERYMEEGFTDYLSKPIDSRQLKEMLMEYLPQEKLEDAAGDVLYENEFQMTDDTYDVKEEETAGVYYSGLAKAGIDTRQGLSYSSNDHNLYEIILDEYAKGADDKAKAIQENYEKASWKDYGILVHSLKSTSRMVGAQELSDIAAELENAADTGDTELIKKEHATLMAKYGTVVAAIRNTDTGQEDIQADNVILEFMPK